MDSRIDLLLVLVPALPLAGAILAAALGPKLLRGNSHLPVILTLLASLVCSLLLIQEVRFQRNRDLSSQSPLLPVQEIGYERTVTLWTWAALESAYQQPQVPPDSESPLALVDGGTHDFRIDITLRADTLTAIMLCMVTLISTLVAIFAAGYMQGDGGYWRFFAYIGLFVFSMTMLVSVSNFLLLFVFWEAVGVCSYLLIGFWYQKPEAAAAGKKAFLVNRVGDLGFALAVMLIWTQYGTLNFHDSVVVRSDDATSTVTTDRLQVATVAQAAIQGTADPDDGQLVRGVLGTWRIAAHDYRTGPIALVICLLLMLGACGKSAQFPLHVWLPDAMEGPTPVSALIHAATMVTAGVYMVTRCTPLFLASPEAQLTVAVIGGGTALLAGLIALTQFDLKRVLAYSTISQLGYMFLALGVGTTAGIAAGMFHLFTHAFFKALLFLGSGSVMHAMGNVIDMRRFGGLRKLMPYTYGTFLVGSLALAGIFPLAGFWSKDAILGSLHDKIHLLEPGSHEAAGGDGHEPTPVSTAAATPWASLDAAQLDRHATVYRWLYYAAMLTAFLTAFYTFRAVFLTFFGPLRVPPEAGHHAHESPSLMVIPLVVLAACAVVVGLLFDHSAFDGTSPFGAFLAATPSLSSPLLAGTPQPGEFHLAVAGTSTLIALAGIVVAAYLYMGDQREVAWLKSFMNFDRLIQFGDVQTVARLRQLRWVQAIHRGASQVGLGWLASLLGELLLLVVLLLSAPLLLGRYVSPYSLSQKKFYFDELYYFTVVKPGEFLARVAYAVDRWLIDGLVNAVGRVPVAIGNLMRSLQMGLIQFYALAMVLGVLIVIAVRVFFLQAG